MKRFILSIVSVLLLLPSLSFAEASNCPSFFFGGQAPDIINKNMSAKTTDICYTAYALKHSGLTNTPLYAAEYLTKQVISNAKGQDRKDSFHAEPSLKKGERAELKDYVKSGYHRGHMAPFGDMDNEKAQHESFSLANMIPQNGPNNTTEWVHIESMTRNLVLKHGSAYVITGPIFIGNSLQKLNNRVFVPTHIFKAIYLDGKNQGAVYISENKANSVISKVSITEAEKMIGISLFPSVNKQVKDKAMPLPD